MRRIPPRVFVSDTVAGHLWRGESANCLSLAPLEGAQAGTFNLRYGVVLLGRSYLSIVPDLIALDYGDALNGEEAMDFLFNKSNLYPRADVFGYRDDGVDDMLTVKTLDLMQTLRVWAYASEQDTRPIAQVHALIAPTLDDLPERLTGILPIYPTFEAWRKASQA
jgi:hypothetical protein